MNWNEDDLDVLQNLEFSAVEIWRCDPAMTDYAVLRAYEAAFQFYRAEARGQTPKPHGLTGLDAEVFDAVKAMCEFRLGRGQPPLEPPETITIPPVPLEKIVDCLRELSKSVQRHTKLGGRQGYLTFVDRYLP
jgi:hypothetical protein